MVASEVRALAQRSASSAKEIKALIGATIDGAATSARTVEAAGTEMQQVMAGIGRVSEHVLAIDRAAGEQCAGIESVGHSVGELDSATQRNAALVEQAAASAEQLKAHARELSSSVAVFRLASP